MSKIIIFASFVVFYGTFSFLHLFFNEKKILNYPAKINIFPDTSFLVISNNFKIPVSITFSSQTTNDFYQTKFEVRLDFNKIRNVSILEIEGFSDLSFSDENLCLRTPEFCEFLQQELNNVRLHN